ncbi:MAG: polyprenyl synthetase family protein [Candidatus Neomarinimicrobiota bacterium]|nr:MAG: polyprenyl synthetase family protein [Candidatus Neomarinimicrobiota bacterium]
MNDAFLKHLEEIRSSTNRALRQLPLSAKPVYLYGPVQYILEGEGKRLRPILVHLSGEAFGANAEDLVNASLAVELLHNFTLVHDDIMDHDDTRHGKPTVHFKWDESTAILAGDGLYAIGQLCISKLSTGQLEAVRAFNQATLMVCEGQAFDKEFEENDAISLDDYFTMIEKKTGWLLGLCAELGAILGRKDLAVREALRAYGLNLGKTFQIQDDLLEIYSDSHQMGKSLGSDVLAGKQTVLTILARDQWKEEWISLNQSLKNKPVAQKLEQLRTFFDRRGIHSRAQEYAREFSRKALATLKVIPDEKRKALELFTDYVLNRKK